jgi:hypothetical protein
LLLKPCQNTKIFNCKDWWCLPNQKGRFLLFTLGQLKGSRRSELAKVPRTKSPMDIAIINVRFFIAVCPWRFRKQLKNHLWKSWRSDLRSVKRASQQNWDHMCSVCTACAYENWNSKHVVIFLIPIKSQKFFPTKSQIMICQTCITTELKSHVLRRYMYCMCLWKLKFSVCGYIYYWFQKIIY